MTCQEFERQEAAYLAGRLSGADARALEAHGASCVRCAARLDAATRVDLSSYAPALPSGLRAGTLAAVRARRDTRITARRWWTGGITAAAAALVLVVGVAQFRSRSGEANVAAPVASTADSALSPAATLAMLSARDEFEELDAAIRELEAALAASPGDAGLRTFLASAMARRAELERQVKDAS